MPAELGPFLMKILRHVSHVEIPVRLVMVVILVKLAQMASPLETQSVLNVKRAISTFKVISACLVVQIDLSGVGIRC